MSRIGTNRGQHHLGGRDPDDLIDRPSRQAEADTLHVGEEHAGKGVQRAGTSCRIDERERVLVRDEQVRTPVVVAAAAGQTSGVPRVDDLEAPGPPRRRATDLRLAVLDRTRGTAVRRGDETAPQDDVSMGAAAAELPSTRHPKAVVDRHGATSREHPAGGDVVEVGPQFGGHRLSSEPGRGRNPASEPIMTHHPTLGSAADSDSINSTCRGNGISGPPHDVGIGNRNAPAAFNDATRSDGSRRRAAISSPRSRTSRQQRLDPTCDLIRPKGRARSTHRRSLPSASRMSCADGRAPAATPPAVVRTSGCLQRSLISTPSPSLGAGDMSPWAA